MIVAALLVAMATPAACHPINQDRIYARDLAAVEPVFAALSPDIAVGFAPAPGQQRIFRAADLRRIAKTHGLSADLSQDICFAWGMAVPSREAILAAMKNSLKSRQARVEIVDQSVAAAPAGQIVFPLGGLCGFSSDPVIWRGYVEYGLNHRFSIWAKARVSVEEPRVISAAPLRTGEPVTAADLRTGSYRGPLSHDNPVLDWRSAVGMIPRFDIPAGTVLTANMLEARKEVERGDIVAVVVETLRTRIEAQGVAEQSGRTGAVITVRNTKTGWEFQARVTEKGKVLVVPGGAAGLIAEDSKS